MVHGGPKKGGSVNIMTPDCKTNHLLTKQQISICALFFFFNGSHFLGVITTVGATYVFLSLMTLYPEKQRKLQQEVNVVIGGRLPRLADRPKMHYMKAVNIYHPSVRAGNFSRACLSVCFEPLRNLVFSMQTHLDHIWVKFEYQGH